ncbi:MAG: hypothetical protein WC359_13690 [Dehalococcoidia bacterium]|jgi:hypothetical protein
MGVTTPLAEYLLAYRDEQGGRVCRFGMSRRLVPVFPAGLKVDLQIYPRPGAYAEIMFFSISSPAMTPNAFEFTSINEGIILEDGPMAPGWNGFEVNVWVEFTDKNPIISTVRNISTTAQYYEAMNITLVFSSEEDLLKGREIIRNYGNDGVAKQLKEINGRLKKLGG